MSLSPMMQHYVKTKKQYKDCILFYRLGDFYEMFFDDAKTASRELDLTLTGKDCGLPERAPMCGVPYHAVDTYLTKLVQKGYKVAICEQMEDPKLAKGIVKREVIRVVTPGTNLSQEALDDTKNNYLMCVLYTSGIFGLAVTDISTGEFLTTQVDNVQMLYDEISRFAPAEIICNDALAMSGADFTPFKEKMNTAVTVLEPWYIDEDRCEQAIRDHFKVTAIEGLGITDMPAGVLACGATLQYLSETQMNSLSNLTGITPYRSGGYMLIDTSTARNLELTETMREKQKRGSLLWVLDHTKTAMGARLMRSWILQPLLRKDQIEERQDGIEELVSNMIDREEIREYLGPVYDLERLITRISYKTAGPRDLIAFKTSLQMLPPIRQQLAHFTAPILRKIYEDMDPLEDICKLIEDSIVDDPPVIIREGGMIRDGYNEDVDKYRSAQRDGKQWLSDLETREREKTGIKNLRIKYNKVFGYYLEVTNSYKDMVPEDWQRRQTLTNAERYITPELKDLENMILGAQDKLSALEYDIFCSVRDRISGEMLRIQKTARAVALLDVLASLAYTAQANNYVRPKINTRGVINIKDGRHPVIEKMIGSENFIANDTCLDNKKHRISIITGPNMAGKSTYMRQSALIVLMAQIGSFVPASSADIGLVDRIFTRVGASDDLASGQSTFMVEMTEVANILRNATSKSLLILDEIGRGTSTYDGLSIAWAVVEYISDPGRLGAKTLFATHYHELTELEGRLDSVNNYCIAVREEGDDIIFIRKIIPGGADKSYGIQVARLAGVPQAVIDRAKEISRILTESDVTDKVRKIDVKTKKSERAQKKLEKEQQSRQEKDDSRQMSLFEMYPEENPVIRKLKSYDISNMTPVMALNALDELQKMAGRK